MTSRALNNTAYVSFGRTLKNHLWKSGEGVSIGGGKTYSLICWYFLDLIVAKNKQCKNSFNFSTLSWEERAVACKDQSMQAYWNWCDTSVRVWRSTWLHLASFPCLCMTLRAILSLTDGVWSWNPAAAVAETKDVINRKMLCCSFWWPSPL